VRGGDLLRTKISKGFQTVVPKKIRAKLDLGPGDSIVWEERGKSIVVKPKKRKSLDDLVGMISEGGDAVADKERVRRGER
jgi:AbrB family looped-hinge helix DNA binding protein